MRDQTGRLVPIPDLQNPVELDDFSQPQPDFALLRPREDFYALAHPRSADIFLLIEVANITLRYDREITILLYVERGICEVWLVDMNGECVEVDRQPMENRYGGMVRLRRDDCLGIEAFSDVEFAVDEILGERS